MASRFGTATCTAAATPVPIEDEDGNPVQPYFRLSVDNDVPMTRENLEEHHPELYAIIERLFPPPETFRAIMGWTE